MPGTKLTLTTFAVALTLSAIGTAAASAAPMGWFVNGTRVAPGTTIALNSKAVVDEPSILNLPGLALKISCTGLTGAGAAIVGLDIGEAESLRFTGCSEIEPATCKVSPAEIETEPITALSTLNASKEVRLSFKPKTPRLFVDINFTGSCAFAGMQPVNGEVKLAVPGGTSEEVNHTLAGLGSTEGNSSLELAGNKAFIEKGKALLKLASGSKWSFHE